ncbi:hypothetical protein N7524_011141 [Penicillium chrysogenum]|nr:hypothetical protein N7524_011141 [Penicillium chrysogenum]
MCQSGRNKCKKKSLPRGIEPRSPALIGTKEDVMAELLLGRLSYCSATWLVDGRLSMLWLYTGRKG